MSIDRGDFDAISEVDLAELVEAQVPEGLRVEYKLESYKNTDAEKREFLKDVSAFANSLGGHLILGVKEEAGVAAEIVGLKNINIDKELLRLEQIARGGLEPRISALRIRSIPLTSGGHVIILRVPRSWNIPHRVIAQGANRFYVRHSAGVHEPNVHELRALFAESGLALEQARRLRSQRLDAIGSGIGMRALKGEGRIVVHIIPIASLSGLITLDVDQVRQQHPAFPIILGGYARPRFNFYGFINEPDAAENEGYTQIDRRGWLEAAAAGIVVQKEGYRQITAQYFEQEFFDAYTKYVRGLKDIGVPPPLLIMVTLENVLGVNYIVRYDAFGRFGAAFQENTLFLPECLIEEYGSDTDHHRVMRPAFDALWNAAGYAKSEFFNEDGLWVGEQAKKA